MKRTALFLFLLFGFFAPKQAHAQGKILAVGGGTEQNTDNSWNSKAYKWAVDNAANGKIAIIGTGDDSGWLSDYFVNKLGAVQAKYFKISDNSSANSEAIYTEIVACDMVFIKGGDQYKYYKYYKDSRLEDAVIEIYNRGGVISGTSAGAAILSEVFFSADKGTVYPEEALEDPFNQYMHLNNDFLPFLKGFIIDTHFAERGRFGRMHAFLAHWYIENNELITGIGIDDQTAFAIDENLNATAFGTGAVNIFIPSANTNFRQNGNKLLLDELKSIQLLDGYSVDLKNIEEPVYKKDITPSSITLNNNFNITITASSRQEDIAPAMKYFISKCENPDDTIYVISSVTNIDDLKQLTESYSGHKLINIDIASVNIDSDSISNIILKNKNFIVHNIVFSDFLKANEGITGKNIQYQLKSNKANVLLTGNASALAGTSFVANYDREGSANAGRLNISKGLNLLKNYTIQPETFDNPDLNENTAAGLPFCMVTDKLHRGIWLAKNTWLGFESFDGKIKLYTENDSFPVILIKNSNATGDFSSTSEYGDGDRPRNIAGFSAMNYRLIDNSSQVIAGDQIKINPEIANLHQLKHKVENGYKFELNFEILNKNNLDDVNVFWGEQIDKLKNKESVIENGAKYNVEFEVEETVQKIYIEYQLISGGDTLSFYRIQNVNESLSLDKINIYDVKAFPNPVSDVLYFKHNFNNKKLKYSIYSMEGKKLKTGEVTDNKIIVKDLKPANYLLFLHHENKTETHKIIKE